VLIALFLRCRSLHLCSPSTLSLASFAVSLVLRLLVRLLSVSYCSLYFALSLAPSPPRSWSSWWSFPSDYSILQRQDHTAGKLTRNIVHCARMCSVKMNNSIAAELIELAPN
jgi:hypothetical protein